MKVYIFGASGSGVSTLGKALSEQLTIPYFDSDDYYWLDKEPMFTHKRALEERNTTLLQDLTINESWALGGPVFTWKEPTLPPKVDLIVFLHIPKEIRMKRLKEREFERFGKSIFTDPKRAKISQDFLAWAADYDEDTGIANRTYNSQKKWLETAHSPVLELVGDLTVAEKIVKILNHIQK
jgi:adenylate kinase family enzyme